MSAERLTHAIARARGRRRAALVGYLTAGDPDPKQSLACFEALARHADIVEVGIPFSDPMADGPVIQRAAERALAAGTRLDDVFALVGALRKAHPELGILLMGYLNSAYARGYARFFSEAAHAGADGVLLVDCPPEEADEPRRHAEAQGLAWVPLLAPTSSPERVKKAAAIASGFIYYVSLKGVTGASLAAIEEAKAKVHAIRRYTDLPVCVGFGVKTPEQAAAVATFADGVVIGSRFVTEIEDHPEEAPQRIAELAETIAKALEKGG